MNKDNKNDYQEYAKKRFRMHMLFNSILLILFATKIIDKIYEFSYIPQNESSFVFGYFMGFSMVLMLLNAGFMIKFGIASNDYEKAKAIYIKTHDERFLLIKTKAGMTNFIRLISVLIFAMLVAGFFNFTVFLTLLCVVFGLCAIQLATVIYYKKTL